MEPANSEYRMCTYDGSAGSLFKVYWKNILLTILTLTVYRFWGQVKLKKFIYQHVSFDGRRFDYHATGLERFIGFLKAAAIFGVIVIAPYAALIYFMPKDSVLAQIIPVLYLYAVIFSILPLVIVGRMRFMLSRTSWNNGRFVFTGSTKELYGLFLKWIGLTIVTFGIYGPFAANHLRKWTIDHSQYGSEKFSFNGKGVDFFALLFLGYILTLITFGIYGFWWAVKIENFIVTNTQIQQRKAIYQVKGIDLLVTTLKAFAITLVTLGIGFPLAVQMFLTMYSGKVGLDGSLDISRIKTVADHSANALAEAMGDVGESLADLGQLM